MYDTDCAGVIFFANQFRFFHEAIEEIFEKTGVPFKTLFSTSPFIFVIVHASADFHQPMAVGDRLIIETHLKKIGTTSVAFSFKMFRDAVLVGKGETIQVCLDAKTRKKQEIPADFKKSILKVLELKD